MDLNALVATVKSSPAAMFSLGLATAHIPFLTRTAFGLALKVPIVRAWIVGNPAQAEEWVDEISKELKQDIEQAAAAPAPAPAAAPAAAAPAAAPKP